MSTDLQTGKGNRYSILAMILFLGYTLVDIPTALTVRRVGPSLWVGTIGTA